MSTLVSSKKSEGAGPWAGAVCVVTGGASGIGRALARELGRRSAVVHVTDVNGEAASKLAGELGAPATSAALDVREAASFKRVIDDVIAQHGRVDYLFNNAGVGVGGEAQDLTVGHWDRVIDVNVRGVVHGVAACYPTMVARRSGHIVNTASMAGLVPMPLITPYTMTKHAIVGLSRALRIEAAGHGVKVSVLCPAATETPLLDADNPKDLPPVSWRPNLRRMLERMGGPPYAVERLAVDALAAVERNEGVIIVPWQARIGRFVDRLVPGLVEGLMAKTIAAERTERDAAPKALLGA